MDIPNYSSSDLDHNLYPDGSVGLGKNPDVPSSNVDCLAKEVQEGPSPSEHKSIKEKKKAKRARNKKLVQEEKESA
ncbi:hypothetical protein RchiOBHm_Chr6g0281921 [Rosa chinensis]|uniref:Uncharacterized protein n=1 Tax=Rosa chinensis TaxID=74649 RepID=A0A2P6PTN6_ROSCH|nr:hypothetical protein RchiOBHm_Chr6g0281921 [Rosa chinensis]